MNEEDQTENVSTEKRKKKKSKKRSASESEREKSKKHTDFSSLLTDLSEVSTSVPKKKHKKSKNASKTADISGDASCSGNSKECAEARDEVGSTNHQTKHKKKKKDKKHVAEKAEEQFENQLSVSESILSSETIKENNRKSKHKSGDGVKKNKHKSKHKKKERKKHDEDENQVGTNEITLEMLDTSNAESISELADKIAKQSSSNNPALRSSTPVSFTYEPGPSIDNDNVNQHPKSKSALKRSRVSTLEHGDGIVENMSTVQTKAKRTKKPTGKRKNNSAKTSLQNNDNDPSLHMEDTNTISSDLQLQSWLDSLEDDMVEDELDFEPSELHKRLPALRGATPQQKEELKAEGVTVRLGKWTNTEDQTIKENLQEFVKKYNVPAAHLLLGINKNSKSKMDSKLTRYLQLKKFNFHLAKGLQNRTLFSTYLRARKTFHPMSKTKVNPEQRSEMFRLTHQVGGNKWNAISEIMNIPGTVLREAARYHMEKGANGEWTAEENEKLTEAVREKLALREDGSCRKLPWKKIAKKVGTRNKGQCCKQWLHNLCWKFSHGDTPKPQWTDEDSYRLVQHLHQLDAEAEADLDWDSICKQFSNVASYSELVHKWYLLKVQVPDYKEKDLEDLIHHLQKQLKLKMKMMRKLKKDDSE